MILKNLLQLKRTKYGYFSVTFVLVRPSAHGRDPTTSHTCCVLWCEENTESLDPDLHALQIRKVLALICMRYKHEKS
jgi:hypothetical protein